MDGTESAPSLTTAVVGAGPAGLLFAVIARILHDRVADPARWSLRLFDKRDTYARTHRLRIAPEPYRFLARELGDARFDTVLDFLSEHHFSPEVNLLEEHLLGVARACGVERELHEFTSLAALRDLVRPDASSRFTVVGADSVHSAVREAVRGAVAPVRFTHQRVARLRVTGEGLPAEIGSVDQYRLSKVLGSLLDYRLNANGFAEVDLFLTAGDHQAVGALGATPKQPVPLTAANLGAIRSPIFRRVVEHLERDLARGGAAVTLASTFLLEQTVMPRRAFAVDGVQVFLVGDAAVSLPFFRGMASLARAARALAHAHVELAAGADASAVALHYDDEVAAIARDELATVRARGRLIRGLREFARVSAMLPFPIQSFWLSAREPIRAADRPSFGLAANAALALVALGLSLAAAFGPAVSGAKAALAAAALLAQAGGGVAYHAALNFEPGPHRLVKRVWQVEIAAALAVGVVLFAIEPRAIFLVFWLVLGAPFVAGLYLLEALGARWERRAHLS